MLCAARAAEFESGVSILGRLPQVLQVAVMQQLDACARARCACLGRTQREAARLADLAVPAQERRAVVRLRLQTENARAAWHEAGQRLEDARAREEALLRAGGRHTDAALHRQRLAASEVARANNNWRDCRTHFGMVQADYNFTLRRVMAEAEQAQP
jgi:hypothetical protein